MTTQLSIAWDTVANGSLDDFPGELAKVVEVAWYNFLWGAGCYPYEPEIPTQQVVVNVTAFWGEDGASVPTTGTGRLQATHPDDVDGQTYDLEFAYEFDSHYRDCDAKGNDQHIVTYRVSGL